MGTQDGISIAGVLIASAMLSVISVAIISLLKNASNSHMDMASKSDLEILKKKLFDGSDCARTQSNMDAATCSSGMDIHGVNGAILLPAAGQVFGQWRLRARCVGTEIHVFASQPNTSGGFARERVSGLTLDENHPKANLFRNVGGLCSGPSTSSGGGNLTPGGKCKTFQQSWTRTSAPLGADGGSRTKVYTCPADFPVVMAVSSSPHCSADYWGGHFQSVGVSYFNSAACVVGFDRDNSSTTPAAIQAQEDFCRAVYPTASDGQGGFETASCSYTCCNL
jgi:hypothetical protein